MSEHSHFYSKVRYFALLIFILLVCIRIPAMRHGGRFWAEEGTIYFVHAWTLPWWNALFLPANGYLSLAANGAGLLARYLVPLQDAPRVTTAIALAIQTIPVFLLITARDQWLRHPANLVAAVLILAMPPACDEVWLNTANSQFHLALAAALCLVLQLPTNLIASSARSLLLFASPLCSPGCIALTPLFIFRAAWDEEKGRIVQAVCIFSGSAIQLALFYTPLPGRGHVLGPTVLTAIFAVKHLAVTFLGEEKATVIADYLHRVILSGHHPIVAIIVVIVTCSMMLILTAIRRRPEPVWLLLSGGALACISYYGALNGGPSLITVIGQNRYAFAPSMLFALAVLSLAGTARLLDNVAVCAWVIVVWILAIAIHETILPQDTVFVQGPRWRTEVRLWHANANHPLAIWPDGWLIHLPLRSSSND